MRAGHVSPWEHIQDGLAEHDVQKLHSSLAVEVIHVYLHSLALLLSTLYGLVL